MSVEIDITPTPQTTPTVEQCTWTKWKHFTSTSSEEVFVSKWDWTYFKIWWNWVSCWIDSYSLSNSEYLTWVWTAHMIDTLDINSTHYLTIHSNSISYNSQTTPSSIPKFQLTNKSTLVVDSSVNFPYWTFWNTWFSQDVKKLEDNKFLYIYKWRKEIDWVPWTYQSYLNAVIGTISWTTITFSSEYFISWYTPEPKSIELSTWRYLVTYLWYDSLSNPALLWRVINIFWTTITVSDYSEEKSIFYNIPTFYDYWMYLNWYRLQKIEDNKIWIVLSLSSWLWYTSSESNRSRILTTSWDIITLYTENTDTNVWFWRTFSYREWTTDYLWVLWWYNWAVFYWRLVNWDQLWYKVYSINSSTNELTSIAVWSLDYSNYTSFSFSQLELRKYSETQQILLYRWEDLTWFQLWENIINTSSSWITKWFWDKTHITDYAIWTTNNRIAFLTEWVTQNSIIAYTEYSSLRIVKRIWNLSWTKSPCELLAEKVDKVDWMWLSENNFSDADKSKLDSLVWWDWIVSFLLSTITPTLEYISEPISTYDYSIHWYTYWTEIVVYNKYTIINTKWRTLLVTLLDNINWEIETKIEQTSSNLVLYFKFWIDITWFTVTYY